MEVKLNSHFHMQATTVAVKIISEERKKALIKSGIERVKHLYYPHIINHLHNIYKNPLYDSGTCGWGRGVGQNCGDLLSV